MHPIYTVESISEGHTCRFHFWDKSKAERMIKERGARQVAYDPEDTFIQSTLAKCAPARFASTVDGWKL